MIDIDTRLELSSIVNITTTICANILNLYSKKLVLIHNNLVLLKCPRCGKKES